MAFGARRDRRTARVNGPQRTSTGLLHNMSAAPRSVIDHHGPSAGRRLWFCLNRDLPARTRLRTLLEVMGGATSVARNQRLEDDLKARINAHALTLNLPPAAVVAPPGENGIAPFYCFEERDTITVLAKSSEHAYLRDKEPILDRIRTDGSVTLILPETWRP
jgi:hypothetical protein